MDVAARHGRRVAIAGRSLENNVRVASELGFLPLSSKVLVSREAVPALGPSRTIYLVTGSQGEPTAALARIAANDHPQIRIVPGDTVIVSASPIPGNEEAVARTIDNLFRLGARVVYKAISPDIHVSGHASRAELAELIQVVRPRFGVPLHGEYRMLVLYKDLAIAEGIPADNVLLADNGDVLEFSAATGRKAGSVPSGSVLVDGLTVGGVTQVVLRDRRHLAEDGVLIASVLIDRTTGVLIREPEIIARGFVGVADAEFLGEARRQIQTTLKRARAPKPEYGFLVEKIKETLSQLVYRKTRKRPMILPLVTEV
jgi:ribonuclease J